MPFLAKPELEYYQAHRLCEDLFEKVRKVKTPCSVILISGNDGYGDTGSVGSELRSSFANTD